MSETLNKYRKHFLENWFDFNSTAMFFVICLVHVALLLVKRIFIINEIAAFEILNERGDLWVFNILYNIQYLSIPLFLGWKWSWTTLSLWVGCFMFGYRLHFNQLWKLVMLTEILFFLPEILKIIWFSIFYTDPNYNDYLAFYPLSLLNFFDYTQIDPKWIYPLKSLNFFELLSWLFLTVGVYFISGKNLMISACIVASSYVFSFLLWLIFYVLVY